jgi:hypothetical protein
MSDPLFPDVPTLSGVPSVFRNASNLYSAATAQPPALTQDSFGSSASTFTWGLYGQDGVIALIVDSVLSIEPSREFRISDYPVQGGGFASYNKVATPQELRVTVTKGGSNADRADFLHDLDALVQSVDLFNLVTPDTTFFDFNVTHYDYKRSADGGAGLLIVSLHLTEVRQTAQFKFTDSKAPSGADVKNDGPVQPVTPTDAQTPKGPPQ